jgi:predicted RNase H-like HicB family nuclease
MIMKIKDYLTMPYAVEVQEEETTDGGHCFVAFHPELPGCMAHGDSREEALENLREAKELYISALLDRDVEVPLPKALSHQA